jgi:hypothetical protein
MQNKLLVISFILLSAFTFTAKGQKLINSPYSRFNIGTLDPSGSFRSLSMGGVGIAMRSNNAIYYTNPASYTSIDTTSFLFDFGFDYSVIDLLNGSDKYRSDDINFDHLLIGFPIGKRVGLATGIVPVSNGYYNLAETVKPGVEGYDPVTGTVFTTHKGEGGLTNFFIGTGVKITKNISAGINLSVLFGELKRTNQFEFADYANAFSEYRSEQLRINGLNLDYGLQYTATLKKDYFFNAGLSMTAAKNYNSELDKIALRFAAYSSTGYSPDTLNSSLISSMDSTRLPQTLRMGIAFGKKDVFVVGIDYISTNWAAARILGSNGYLANTNSLLFGVEYIPEKYSNSSFLKKIEYRTGGHIGNNYLLIKNTQIKEYGVSCGLGFRLRNSFSQANVFFDYTRKNGDFSKGLHNENYYTIGFSLNLYDFWFVKRRYD